MLGTGMLETSEREKLHTGELGWCRPDGKTGERNGQNFGKNNSCYAATYDDTDE